MTEPARPVTRYLVERLARLLEERRVVVWYDADGVFHELAAGLRIPDCEKVLAVGSQLVARRKAEEVYRRLGAGSEPGAEPPTLLIYLPMARGATQEERQDDPFEGFGRCGAFFGNREADSLLSLATAALPKLADEVERLFRESKPTLELLDGLGAGPSYPLMQQALGTESPTEALVAALALPEAGDRLAAVPGSMVELARLAERAVGLPAVPSEGWPALRRRLGSYLLVSELAAHLSDGLSVQLETVPHAGGVHADRAAEVCRRLRDSESGRDAYVEMATRIEADLRLEDLLTPDTAPGAVDSFPIQERLRLKKAVARAAAGNLEAARSELALAAGSVFAREPERALLWNVARRCLAFLEEAERLDGVALPTRLSELVALYTAPQGLWRLDRAQRLFEQAAVQCGGDDEVDPLIQRCRESYRAALERLQGGFQPAVAREGWPPEGTLRQTRLFDRCVAPELAESRKVAYFLVDGLRYEMGMDLAEALGVLGRARVEMAATVLPTTTACGMAALMPGADGSFALVESSGGLVPAVAGTALAGAADRRSLLAARYGDRVLDITLGDLLSMSTRRLRRQVGSADLVVVRTQDIDAMGEGYSLFHARKSMSDVIGELRSAASRLADLGFRALVFASDHGHLLLPEILPGDVATAPPGEWRLAKRRSLLGRSLSRAAGVMVLPAAQVGIEGPVEELAVTTGVRTFQAGSGYFHEGLSLQECLVPMVTLRATPTAAIGKGDQVSLTYRSDRFTSSVIGLKLRLDSMLSSTISVKLEGYPAGGKGQAVAEAGECDALDHATKEVVLKNGVDTPVPLLVSPDFHGDELEIRAWDPRTGATLAGLTLKNARME